MSKQLSSDKLLEMASIATEHEQLPKQQPSYTPILTGAIAASIVGIIALTSAYYSADVGLIESDEEMVDLIVYESFESDFF